MMELISRFRGKYKFLSNFYPAEFEYEGRIYKTVEHAYQEQKTLDEDRRKEIREAPTAFASAKLGRSKDTILREDWFEIKKVVMQPLVYAKFKQNPDLARKLILTDDAYLMEGNYWHDNYFGNCSCKKCHEGESGQNWLGRILMRIRGELTEESGGCNT